jgi:hypothetical protein
VPYKRNKKVPDTVVLKKDVIRSLPWCMKTYSFVGKTYNRAKEIKNYCILYVSSVVDICSVSIITRAIFSIVFPDLFTGS